MSDQVGKNWCFTINNWTEDDIKILTDLECRYIVFGKEIGKEGTPHLQGFVVFNQTKKLSGVKKVHDTAHWEATRGTSEQAATYCKKDGDFTERGEPPMTKRKLGEIEKNRWDDAYDAVKEGRFDDVPNDMASRGAIKNLLFKASLTQKKPRLSNVDCRWYFGPSGTGKTTDVDIEFPDYFEKGLNKWWDGYTNQETVLIDEWDLDTSRFLGTHLKKWSQKFAFNAETKGGTMCIRPKRIIITSNYTMKECFGHDKKGLLVPLERRFKQYHFTHVHPDVIPQRICNVLEGQTAAEAGKIFDDSEKNVTA